MPQRAPDHILLIEDDATLSLWIEEVLRDAGTTKVTHCISTQEAMVALKDGEFDCIILDVHLADRDDGWAIAELIQSVTLKRPQIIFSTGSPDDIPDHIAKLGTLLEKPYTEEALVSNTRIGGKSRNVGLLKGLVSVRA